MNTEDFRVQVRELLARRPPSAQGAEASRSGRAQGVCVPLRLSAPSDLGVLAELIRRVSVSPALAEACATGLLRFELSISAAMASAMPAAPAPPLTPAPATSSPTCCTACSRGEACSCPATGGAPAGPTATPWLRGCITERDIKALPADCRLVRTAPRTQLTPLARDALRQRGITVQPSKEA